MGLDSNSAASFAKVSALLLPINSMCPATQVNDTGSLSIPFMLFLGL